MTGSVEERPCVAPPLPSGEYHAFYRTAGFRRWQSLVALAIFVTFWGACVLGAAVVAVVYELAVGGATVEELSEGAATPALFLANNVGVALAIPAAVLTQFIVFHQRPGWLFSVRGRLRWPMLGQFLMVASVIHLAMLGTWLAVAGPPDGLQIRSDTWLLLAAVLLTTPLQAAGEEVAFRGLATRCIGSWFDQRRLGLVVATASTAAVFTLAHGSRNGWLMLFYLALAVTASLVTWWAGGLEAAISLHVVVNLTTMLFVPFLGLTAAETPDHGAWQAVTQTTAIVATGVAFFWHVHRSGIRTHGVMPG
jgi:membrane protease YdiL (CAAX protease family)